MAKARKPAKKSPPPAKGKPARRPQAKALPAAGAGVVFRLKITLRDSHPPIWRRILVEDCTLDKLHEHIQTAMGWTNSHLHHFIVGEQYYGDPLLMQENFEDFGYIDSTVTMLSDVLPKTNRKFRFLYEYDFGDSWYHVIEFEGRAAAEPGVEYPVCVDGARACPPEDVGGVWGYEEFAKAMSDKRHPRHRELKEWHGGAFDPEEFDPTAATKAMHRGLPDWRSMM